MLKLFCLKCNKPTSYEQSPPKFCSHCGKPYLESSAASSSPKFIPQPKITPHHNLDDDDEDNISTFNPQTVSEIAYDTDALRPNREKIQLEINPNDTAVNETVATQKGGRKSKINKSNAKLIQDQWASQFTKNTRGKK